MKSSILKSDIDLKTQIEAAIGRLIERAPVLFDGNSIVEVKRRSVLTRPFSHLFWIEAVLEKGVERLIVKIPRPEAHTGAGREEKVRMRLQKEYETARLLSERLAGRSDLKSVKAVAYFEEVPALVLEEVEGMNLRDLIIRKGQWFPSPSAIEELERACLAAGKWLRGFQQMTRQAGERLSLDPMVEYVDHRLKQLVEFGRRGLDRNRRLKILEMFRLAHGEINGAEFAIAGVHADFCPSNVLYSGSEVVPVDFSTFQTGSVYYDLTRFYHQLGLFLNKPSFQESTLNRLRGTFLKGYDEKLNKDSVLFNLFMVQHLACHWLGRLKSKEVSFHEQLYNRWVCHRHRQALDRILI